MRETEATLLKIDGSQKKNYAANMLFAIIHFGAQYHLFTFEKHIYKRMDYIQVCK
jgi:hypothetical protein